ncbi:MAG TPA: choice-of-anchor tandem repeat GloVer-containing protein [Rhizomicrobium sp.]
MPPVLTLLGNCLAGCVVAIVLPLLSGAVAANASEKVLYSFQGGRDGAFPGGGLIADDAGDLYGTTSNGGAGCPFKSGCGTVFKITPVGAETVLYAFQANSDGAGPNGIIADKSGNFFGTTQAGGTYDFGTVFKLAPNGEETVLYAFHGAGDGGLPIGNPVKDGNGNLYGVTLWGGNTNQCNNTGCGTVFELQPNGNKITLYAFQGGNDGAAPITGLVADASGDIYGTTSMGGNCDSNSSGCGVVFKITPGGTETVLYAFQGGSDGSEPDSVLKMDKAGILYGTTAYGGSSTNCPNGSQGCGTVFKLAPDGTETVLYAFQGGSDGQLPTSGLIADNAGNLYGPTVYGGGTGCGKTGHIGCGTIFKLAPDGTETVLCMFKRSHGYGRYPSAALLKAKDGLLYGTTQDGGAGYGVVFSLKK